MGTRADFYIGRGEDAEWVGSIAYDGYPERKTKPVRTATTEATFRAAVAKLTAQDDGTTPDMGWPWPWDDSRTTDYAYAFDGGKVWASCFGHEWFDATLPEPEDRASGNKVAVFPNMKERAKMAEPGTSRSGIGLFRMP